MFKIILKEPLVHFLLAGFLLFVYFNTCSSSGVMGNTVIVDKDVVLNYMQYQSKAFNREVFENKMDQFESQEKQQIIQNYIADEVLYREAVKLGLDQNDFVIKRRVIQKMEFILDDFDAAEISMLRDSMLAYYNAHKDRYFQPEHVTFTHVFFKNDERKNALYRANSFMANREDKKLTATDGLAYGDRFLYHRNYAEKTSDFLESQFGNEFVHALKNLEADDHIWQGPIQSDHGYHLILLIDKTVGRLADLEEIQSVVKADYMTYLKKRHKKEQIDRLVKEYDVEIDW